VSSCNFHDDLYSGILVTPIILWDLAVVKAAWDQTCLNIILLINEQFSYYTAHHWAVVISMLAYIVASLPLAGSPPTYCCCGFIAVLLIMEQFLRLPCQLIIVTFDLSHQELAKLYWCVVWQGLGACWLPCHHMTSLSFIGALCRHHCRHSLRHHAAFYCFLRLHADFFSIILLTIRSSFMRLLIDVQLRLPCRLIVVYCSRLAVLS
jgi:hypothetical protein